MSLTFENTPATVSAGGCDVAMSGLLIVVVRRRTLDNALDRADRL
jgi:hypothetical protein